MVDGLEIVIFCVVFIVVFSVCLLVFKCLLWWLLNLDDIVVLKLCKYVWGVVVLVWLSMVLVVFD